MPFVLIGGKSPLNYKNFIEDHIVKLANRVRPNILFCPYAAINSIDKVTAKFHELMKNINCNIIDLNLNNLNQFEEYLNISDIIYISGGWCDDLVDFFIRNGLDKILAKYINTNKVFAGSSAGAMLFCRCAMCDKYRFSDNFHFYNYKMVECLGYLNINICPHYQEEDLIVFNEKLLAYPYDAFGIEEDTALVILKDSFYVIKEKKNRSIYYFDKESRIMKPLYEGEIYEKIGGFRS